MPLDSSTTTGTTGSVLPLSLESVRYEVAGKRLIDDVSMTLFAGPCTFILGPNGAGKSLLLRLCHGLIAPTAGSIAWATADRAALRRSQAMVFQKPVLLRRSVAANVAYALRVRGVPRRTRREIMAEALAEAGLTGLAEQPARTLSGGEQQRLALARAWAQRPQVLFLDEPTASLDPAAVRKVEEMVQSIAARGTKIVMSTHDLGQARHLADEIYFLHRGRILEHAPAARFFAAPKSQEAAAFLEGRLLW